MSYSFAEAFAQKINSPDVFDATGASVTALDQTFISLGEISRMIRDNQITAANAEMIKEGLGKFSAGLNRLSGQLVGVAAGAGDDLEFKTAFNRLVSQSNLGVQELAYAVDEALVGAPVDHLVEAASRQLTRAAWFMGLIQVAVEFHNHGLTATAITNSTGKALGVMAGIAGGNAVGAVALAVGLPIGAAVGSSALIIGTAALAGVLGGYYASKGAEAAWEGSVEYFRNEFLPSVFSKTSAALDMVATDASDLSMRMMGRFDGTWLAGFVDLSAEQKAQFTTLIAGFAGTPVSDALNADLSKLFGADFQAGALSTRDTLLKSLLLFAKDNGYLTERVTVNQANVTIDLPHFSTTALVKLRDMAGDQLDATDQRGWALTGPARVVVALAAGTHAASEQDSLVLGSSGVDGLIGGSGDDDLVAGAGQDILLGNGGSDHLYGGADDDVLDGGAGGDWLYGGAGADTYQLTGGQLGDVIVDSDGSGVITVNGQQITGGKKAADGYWISDDHAWGYLLAGNGDLIVSNGTDPDKITIRGWQNSGGNHLGVVLSEEEVADSPPPSNVMTGDFLAVRVANQGADITRLGQNETTVVVVQSGADKFTIDASGNLLSGGDYLVVTNTLYGSTASDSIDGGLGNDLLSGGAGDDQLDGGDGDDMIGGGSGDDVIMGGAGADFISSSTNPYGDRQQYGPLDDWSTWGKPTGATVLASGATWGVYVLAGKTYWDGMLDPRTDVQHDVIDAGDDDDQVLASWGDDHVYGGEGNDDVSGLAASDVIDGGSGDDNLNGDGTVEAGLLNSVDGVHHGSDFIDGGIGNDTIQGDGGADQLFGGADNDHIYGDTSLASSDPAFLTAQYHGADYIDGEDGDDYAEGNGGDDVLYGGDGADILWGDTTISRLTGSAAADTHAWGADALYGDGGNDSLVGGGGADVLFGGDGNDQLVGDENNAAFPAGFNGADYLDGGAGDDVLLGGGLDDILYGGAGADTLRGDDIEATLAGNLDGADFLDGQEDNDTLQGGGGNDVLLGGTGDDSLQGDEIAGVLSGEFHGDDQLDGQEGNDSLTGAGGSDTLIGGDGDDWMRGDDASPDLAIAFHGNDYLDGGLGNDTLLGDGGADILIGGVGADYLAGGDGDDVYRLEAGDAVPDALGRTDTIVDAEGKNSIELGGASLETLYVQAATGLDLYVKYSDDDIVIVTGALGSDAYNYVIGGESFSTNRLVGMLSAIPLVVTLANGGTRELGGFNADSITVTAASSVVSGGMGDDTLAGSGGNNTYQYEAGEGFDTIRDTSAKLDAQGQQVKNRVAFGAGIYASDLQLSLVAGQLTIQVSGYDGEGILIDGFDPADAAAAVPIDEFAFADGTVLSYEQLVALGMDGSGGDDLLSGTAVADALRGQSGNDTLTGLLGDDTLDGGAGDDSLTGGEGSDTYVWGLGAGVDLIDDADSAGAGTDTLRITGLAPSDLIINANSPDLMMRWGTDGDSVTIKNFMSGTAGVEQFLFDDGTVWDTAAITARISNDLTEGSDSFTGTVNDDVIDGKGGNDTLRGGAGNDTLIGGAGGDSLDGAAGNDVLIGGSGNDALTASTGNDTLDGGVGNDTLTGADGADTYLFGRGDGQDYIWDASPDGSVDVLRLRSGIVAGDVRVQLLPSGPTLTIVGTGDQINLGTNVQVERIEFADGTSWSHEQIQQRAMLDTPTEGDDSISAFSSSPYSFYADGLAGNDRISITGTGNQTIVGGDGFDTLTSGAGNDTLQDGETMSGGLGADTYVLTTWQAAIINEAVEGASVVDTLVLPVGTAPDGVRVERGYNSATRGYDDLRLVSPSGYGPAIVVSQFFLTQNAQDNKIERVLFGDGTVWTTADVYAHDSTFQITDQADSIVGFRGADVIDAQGGNDTIQGYYGDDQLNGGAGDDLLYGDTSYAGDEPGAGNDTLEGGIGNDTLAGGGGNDTYLWGRGVGNDRVTEVAGIDTLALASGIVPADVSLWRVGQDLIVALDTGPAQLTVVGHFAAGGAAAIDGIQFGDGTVWDGAAIAAAATWGTQNAMTGTSGNDIFTVDNTSDTVSEAAGQGSDTIQSWVAYALPGNVENLTLTGYLNVDGTGNDANNTIRGNSGNNALFGASYVLMTSMATGADTFVGGAGDDSYYVNGATGHVEDHVVDDTVQELAGEGDDTVYVWAYDYTLPVNVENLVGLNRSLEWYTYDMVPIQARLTGNALDNLIDFSGSRAAGAVLDGGAGADTMLGGSEDDTFIVDNLGDVVLDSGISTRDAVESSVSYTLAAALENLTLAGSQAINGTGNASSNVIDGAGNTAANVLTGGLGNDSYLIGAGDTVVEVAGEGVDSVTIVDGAANASYSLASFVNVENLALTDVLNEAGASGDASNNVLTGNRYSNTLVGDAGDDILYDQTSATNGFDHDVLYGGLGNDTLQSLYGADLLDGGAGDDLIRDFGVGTIVFGHGYGHDTLVAHDASLARSIRFNADVSPADLKFVRAGADVVISLGVDDSLTVTGFYPDPTAAVSNELIGNLQFADGARIEQGIVDALAAGSLDLFASRGKNLVFGSPGAESLSAGSSDSAIYGLEGNDSIGGSSGADILDGGAGADSLVGAAGDDTYMVDDAADVVLENAGAGADSVYSSTSYALAANVENLILTGTDASNGTGNELANWMQGNAAGNTLDGGAGADSLLAGAGDDLYIVDDLGDFVVENAAEGSDTVHSSVWYTLTENTENLVLTGTASISGYGNSLANWMQGNAADNTLDGRAGADSMVAGWGNDTYFVDDLGDLVVEDAGQGIDSVYSSVSYTLTENTENLVLAGGDATNGYGNALANWMQGNAAANLLDGGAGADSLLAGAGDDTYVVDDFGDFVVENPDEGLDTVYSSVSYTLRANTENLVLTGSAANGYGNSLANWMHGNALDNLLDGGTGADGMQGDGGNDTYIVDDIADVVTESAGGGIDTVYASVSYAIGDNVENMVLTGASAADGHGNALANWMQGNDAANLLAGGEGNDALNGMGGVDTLDGGDGDDVYGFDRGSGSDLLVETGSSSGDAAQFGSGIDIDQLWFTQTSSDLLVQVIGTSDYLTVKDWYNTSSPGRVDVFRTSDGHALQESNVQSLVDAMASFAPPAAGETHLSADYQSQLGPTIAASWQ